MNIKGKPSSSFSDLNPARANAEAFSAAALKSDDDLLREIFSVRALAAINPKRPGFYAIPHSHRKLDLRCPRRTCFAIITPRLRARLT